MWISDHGPQGPVDGETIDPERVFRRDLFLGLESCLALRGRRQDAKPGKDEKGEKEDEDGNGNGDAKHDEDDDDDDDDK